MELKVEVGWKVIIDITEATLFNAKDKLYFIDCGRVFGIQEE